MRVTRLFFLFLFLTTILRAQDQYHTDLHGRIYSEDGDVAATHILNITSHKFTISDTEGFFKIPVKLFDTLVISAIQFKRKELVVTSAIFEQELLQITMEAALTELSEVVVMPYNLTGDLTRDAGNFNSGSVITASTLNLPNAYVKAPSKAERELFEATSGSVGISLNPILNGISGRTKMLKRRVARNKKYERTQRVQEFYADSLFRTGLKIQENQIEEFLYFCEVDDDFQRVVDTHDRLAIWDFMKRKSAVYLKNYEEEE